MSRIFMPVAVAAALVTLSAQEPQIQHARMETHQATSLERDVAAIEASAVDPVWVAWREPILDGEYNSCCWYSSDGVYQNPVVSRGCLIDPQTPGQPRPTFAPTSSSIQLEAGTGLLILARIVDKHVERLRTYSDDCPLDANNRTVHWFNGVTQADSIKYLLTLLDNPDLTISAGRSMADTAISAIGLHRDPTAFDTLVTLAHTPDDPHTRAQALYLIGRRGGARAEAELDNALKNDRDAEVRRRAVTGLGQLPHDAGVPALIELVKTSREADLKREAMTWLGRSKDPRAVAFVDGVLKK